MKIVLFGAGYWGSKLLRVLNEIPDVELNVVEPNEQTQYTLKRIYKGIPFFKDGEALIKDPDVVGCIIATPASTHYEIAKKCLQNGKNVFVEKPIAGNSTLAYELLEISHKIKKVLMVGHTLRYSPAVIKVKELIDKGEIGEIFYIASRRINLGIYRDDVDVLWDLLPHDLSVLFYWLGEEPEKANGFVKDAIIEKHTDVGFVNLRFPSGIICHIEVSWVSPVKIRSTVVAGDKGYIIYDDTNTAEPVKLYRRIFNVEFQEDNWFLTHRIGDVYVPHIEGKEPLKLEMEHFIQCIKYKRTPLTNGEEAYKVIKAIEMIEKSVE